MLEYDDFNELDNDFITAWSKYFLRGQQAEIIKEIEYLAEMGQVNAVQCWYLFRNKGQSQNIDKVADYLCKDVNFNMLYIRANQEGLEAVADKVNKIYNDLQRKYARGGLDGYGHFEKDLVEEIKEKVPYYKIAIRAITSANEEYEQSKNLLVGERVVEMHTGFREMWPFDERRLKHEAVFNAKKLRKHMIAEYERLKKENPNLTVDDCPQLAYALGKNYYHWVSKSPKKLGTQLLTDLSNRPYSTKLEIYKNKREKEKERKKKEEDRRILNKFFEESNWLY